MTFSLPFTNPWFLALLTIPLGLLAWAWSRKDCRLVLPLDHARPGSGAGYFVLINLAESIPPLLLLIAILLLAGPQRLTPPKTKRTLTNIEMCVDISYSMTEPFGDGNRYDTAMKAVEEFCTFRKGDAYGLTFFGNNVLHWCPLTSDISAIRCSPPFMKPDQVPPWFNGTEIARALKSCKGVLTQRQEGDRMILLLTDGESPDLRNNGPALAKELKDENITVFAVIIGMEQIQDEIITITHTTGGEAFMAGDPEALKAVFKRIDSMKQTKLEKSVGDNVDDFWLLCLVGLVLVGLFTCALFGLRYTPW
jgi:Ca-activated chloride channel homolog